MKMLCIAFLHVGGAVGCDVPIILSLSLSLSCRYPICIATDGVRFSHFLNKFLQPQFPFSFENSISFTFPFFNICLSPRNSFYSEKIKLHSTIMQSVTSGRIKENSMHMEASERKSEEGYLVIRGNRRLLLQRKRISCLPGHAGTFYTESRYQKIKWKLASDVLGEHEIVIKYYFA